MWRKSYITLVFIKKSDGRLYFSLSLQVSFVCMRMCRVVYLFVCFPVLRVCMLPEGKQPVWGVICFYRGWQLITNPDKHWGRVEGRERERWQTRARKREEIAPGGGIGIWIPLIYHRGGSDPAVSTSAWVWTWVWPLRGRPPRPLTTNKPPSLTAHMKIAGCCGKGAEFLDALCKSMCLLSTAALISL